MKFIRCSKGSNESTHSSILTGEVTHSHRFEQLTSGSGAMCLVIGPRQDEMGLVRRDQIRVQTKFLTEPHYQYEVVYPDNVAPPFAMKPRNVSLNATRHDASRDLLLSSLALGRVAPMDFRAPESRDFFLSERAQLQPTLYHQSDRLHLFLFLTFNIY